jgi:hypothetical protein
MLAEIESKPIAEAWVRSARAALARGPDDALTGAARSDTLFVVADPEDWQPFFGDAPPPAYVYGGLVYFTPEFRPFDPATQRGFGPLCRAAMVVHESVHVFDSRSGEPEIHVSEWDEPRFSAVAPELQRHNPSAYASFAAQVHHRKMEWPRDVRFGAGQPAV